MDTEHLKKNIIPLAIGILICSLVVAMNGMGWMKFAYDGINVLTEPVSYWSGEVVTNTRDFFQMLGDIGRLKSDNDELNLENALLTAENSKIEELETKNELLNDLLEIKESADIKSKQARILGLDSNNTFGYVVIDLGSDDNVEKGDVVILGNILIGRVRDVYSSTSRVALISSKNSNIVAMDQKSRAKGLVHGSLDGIVMENILDNEEVEIGDMVVSWEDETPQGLVIGKIVEVDNNPTSSTKTAKIDLLLQLEDLEYVFVILDY